MAGNNRADAHTAETRVDAARAKLAQGACAVVSKEDAERVRDGEQNG